MWPVLDPWWFSFCLCFLCCFVLFDKSVTPDLLLWEHLFLVASTHILLWMLTLSNSNERSLSMLEKMWEDDAQGTAHLFRSLPENFCVYFQTPSWFMITVQYHLFHRRHWNRNGRDTISFSVLCPGDTIICTVQTKALRSKRHLNKLNEPRCCYLVDLQFKFRLT